MAKFIFVPVKEPFVPRAWKEIRNLMTRQSPPLCVKGQAVVWVPTALVLALHLAVYSFLKKCLSYVRSE